MHKSIKLSFLLSKETQSVIGLPVQNGNALLFIYSLTYHCAHVSQSKDTVAHWEVIRALS